jgi:hypothetical protein
MTSRPLRLCRKLFVALCVFLVGVGFASTVLLVFRHGFDHDAALIRSTGEVEGIIARIYEHRRTAGEYPVSLAELRPIAGDNLSKRAKNNPTEDQQFCADWCWTYMHKPGIIPPMLRRYVGDHGDLVYLFAPSGVPVQPSPDEIPAEGWFVTSEGRTRFLRSFFSKNKNSARRE